MSLLSQSYDIPGVLELDGLQSKDLLPYTPATLDDLCNTYLIKDLAEGPDYDDGTDSTQLALSSFQGKTLASWDGEDCMDWASFVCDRRGIGYHEVDVKPFGRVKGTQLQKFKIQHFSALVGDIYGAVFFEEFRVLRKMSKGKSRPKRHDPLASSDVATSSPTSKDTPILQDKALSLYSYDTWQLSEEDYLDLDRYCTAEEDGLLYLTLEDDPYQPEDVLESYPPKAEESLPSGGVEGEGSSKVHEKVKRSAKDKVKTKTRRGERKPKVWEFLVRLLLDPQTNPLLVQWQNEESSTFVLNKPDIIARLWGARNGNPDLTYNNFARGLRYHYNTGAIELVPEYNFMYRCGPKALRFLEAVKMASSS